MPNQSSRSTHVRGEADADGHVADGVFEDEVPADDPGDQLAHGGVGVGVGAAGDGDHRGQLGVAEAGEGADDGDQDERERERGAGAGAAERWRSGGRCSRAAACCRMEEVSNFWPAMAVPMTVKMPEPMTAPMPSAVSDHGPERLLQRDARAPPTRQISLSMDLQAKSWFARLTLPGVVKSAG